MLNVGVGILLGCKYAGDLEYKYKIFLKNKLYFHGKNKINIHNTSIDYNATYIITIIFK